MTPAKPILKGIDQLTKTGFRCHRLPINGVHFKIEMCFKETFSIDNSVPGVWDYDTCSIPSFSYVNPEGLAKEYWYRVRAWNAEGFGPWSDPYHIMLFKNPMLKIIPTGLIQALERLWNKRKY